MNKWTFLASIPLFLMSCKNNGSNLSYAAGLDAISVDQLKKNIQTLSSDEFEGRKPFTPGESKTISFLEKAFKEVGLTPGNGSSYLQEVPMVNITSYPSQSMLVYGKENFSLKGFDDYVIWTDKIDGPQSFNQDEVVFAGYGVVAPEYDWNDYEGIDVKGKIVMVLVNDPGFYSKNNSLFKGDTMTYYGRWTYKFEEAARQGAKGCLIVHHDEGAAYPFSVVQNSWNASKLRLDPRGKQEQLCDIVGWVSLNSAIKLLEAGGQDSTLLTTAETRDFKATPLFVKLSTKIDIKTTFNSSNNVVGIIPGTSLRDEYIIYTAHWDHLGIGKPNEKGDSIYNGALDNATGTAALIEVARAFKSLPQESLRTIVFLAVTAEEQGLWGSNYYANNPIYPVNKTVANINMDVMNPFGKTKDIIVVGRGQSELEDYLEEAAKKAGRYVAFENSPSSGFYYRSDHFNFAKVGVPALYTEVGIDMVEGGKEAGENAKKTYTNTDYHRPSDEYLAESWTMEGAIEDIKLLFQVGKRLAFQRNWPEWKEGSEFKAIREKSLDN